MNAHRLVGLLALITSVTLSPCPVVAAEAGASSTTSADEDMRTMTAFFFPSAPILDFITQGCGEAYRTQLMKDSGLVEMDKGDLAGIIDHMVAKSQAYCQEQAPAFIKQIRARIGREWGGRVSVAENARLANIFAPDVAIAERARIRIKPGETAKEASDRGGPELSYAEQKDFVERQALLAQAPGGLALIRKVNDYQAEVKSHQNDDLQSLFELVRAAVRSAKASANEYARERGYSDLYPQS
ncbi:MAG TPA: hypothetical protein VL094_11940 [Sphingomonadaceae bacterium]|nr:hypothetical protein [Sphingomonadaceae bacterium]